MIRTIATILSLLLSLIQASTIDQNAAINCSLSTLDDAEDRPLKVKDSLLAELYMSAISDEAEVDKQDLAITKLLLYANTGHHLAESYICYFYYQDYRNCYAEKGFVLHYAHLSYDWLAAASADNNPYAQEQLSWRYMHGIGIPQSYRLAIKWYQAAEKALTTDVHDTPQKGTTADISTKQTRSLAASKCVIS